MLNLAMVFTAQGKEGSVYDGAWTSSVSKEELIGRYSGWEPEVVEIMKVSPHEVADECRG